MTLIVREATRADFPQMITLIQACGLYTESVQMGAGLRYWICIRDEQIVGAVGMEHNGSAGLLRSMAVHPETRGEGVASLLLHEVAKFALQHNIFSFFIFTIGPSTWAERWEFEQVSPRSIATILPSAPQVQSGLRHGWLDLPQNLGWQVSAQRLFQLSQNRL